MLWLVGVIPTALYSAVVIFGVRACAQRYWLARIGSAYILVGYILFSGSLQANLPSPHPWLSHGVIFLVIHPLVSSVIFPTTLPMKGVPSRSVCFTLEGLISVRIDLL